MKANPGGPVEGAAILGRGEEITAFWRKLEVCSVLLTAERRVGKTSVLRKMAECPRNGWLPILCWVESARHPIDCVERIYSEADQLRARSPSGVWLSRIKSAYKTLANAEFAGWKLPGIQSNWKTLLRALLEDIATSTDNRIVIMLDEFPLMVANIIDDHGASIGMEFLDTLREVRQRFEPSGKVRFILSGSVGLHLIVQHLKGEHGYKNNPTNNMALMPLTGMTEGDTELMCQAYLDDERITRKVPAEFSARMFQLTDGLPIYIQHVCERFQDGAKAEVCPDDIDRVLRDMMDSREIEWFRDSAQRIESYYARLRADQLAFCILRMLCRQEDFVSEKEIVDFVRSQLILEQDHPVLTTLDLLWQDNYVVRDSSLGQRRYRFRYGIMRRWWLINKG